MTGVPGAAGKSYTGYRTHTAAGGVAGVAVTVHEDGRDPRPLDPRLDLRNHSPTGFEWGYLGSGPAQLALALCADVLADDDRAQDVYQGVKFKLVSRLAGDEWTLFAEVIRRVIAEVERSRDRGLGAG